MMILTDVASDLIDNRLYWLVIVSYTELLSEPYTGYQTVITVETRFVWREMQFKNCKFFWPSSVSFSPYILILRIVFAVHVHGPIQ